MMCHADRANEWVTNQDIFFIMIAIKAKPTAASGLQDWRGQGSVLRAGKMFWTNKQNKLHRLNLSFVRWPFKYPRAPTEGHFHIYLKVMWFTMFTSQKHQEIITWSAELKPFSSAVPVVNQTASAFHALMAAILREITEWHEKPVSALFTGQYHLNSAVLCSASQNAVSAYITSKQIQVSFLAVQSSTGSIILYGLPLFPLFIWTAVSSLLWSDRCRCEGLKMN